jgi:hypothetical protein
VGGVRGNFPEPQEAAARLRELATKGRRAEAWRSGGRSLDISPLLRVPGLRAGDVPISAAIRRRGPPGRKAAVPQGGRTGGPGARRPPLSSLSLEPGSDTTVERSGRQPLSPAAICGRGAAEAGGAFPGRYLRPCAAGWGFCRGTMT